MARVSITESKLGRLYLAQLNLQDADCLNAILYEVIEKISRQIDEQLFLDSLFSSLYSHRSLENENIEHCILKKLKIRGWKWDDYCLKRFENEQQELPF